MMLIHILNPVIDHELMLDNFLITNSVQYCLEKLSLLSIVGVKSMFLVFENHLNPGPCLFQPQPQFVAVLVETKRA